MKHQSINDKKEKSLSQRIILLLIVASLFLIGQSLYNLSNLDNVERSIVTMNETTNKLSALSSSIATPIAKIRMLSMEIVLAPNKELIELAKQELEVSIASLNKHFLSIEKSYENILVPVKGREEFHHIVKAWERYYEALQSTIYFIDNGVRVGAFISVTKVEKARYNLLLDALRTYSQLQVLRSSKVYTSVQEKSDTAYYTLIITAVIEVFILKMILFFVYKMFKTYMRTSKEHEEKLSLALKKTKDSIEYASLIQYALLPSNDILQKYFKDSFTIWDPKDVVGGDIYLMEEISEDEVLLMVIDCTGHGVPGAFVSMLVKAIERQILSNIHDEKGISPAKMLSVFNKQIKHLLRQDNKNSISNAGFDGGILYYNRKEKIVRYAGSETPLFYYQDGEMNMFKGDRHSIGYKKSDPNFEFKDICIDVSQETQLFISTDGYFDQCGGEKGFPFGKKRYKALLEKYIDASFADKQEALLQSLFVYEDGAERNDDVTIIGLKV